MDKVLLLLAVIVALVLAHSEEGEHSQEDYSNDEPNEQFFDEERGHHHTRIPPPPPYLRNVTNKARKEYITILRNMSLTISQQDREIQAWAEKYGVAEEFAEFNTNINRLKEEVKRNVTQLVFELPQAVEKAFEVMENKNQTFLQLLQGFKSLTKENPPLYRAVKFINDIFYRRAFEAPGIPRSQILEETSSATDEDAEETLLDKIHKQLKEKAKNALK